LEKLRETRKKRDQLSLLAATLEAAEKGSIKTKIMYSANLSFKLLEKYLGAALSMGFVQRESSTYILTEKGVRFLKRYNSFNNNHLRIRKKYDDLFEEQEMLKDVIREMATKHLPIQ